MKNIVRPSQDCGIRPSLLNTPRLLKVTWLLCLFMAPPVHAENQPELQAVPAHPVKRGSPQAIANPNNLSTQDVTGKPNTELVLSVYDENHVLLNRQAVIKLTNQANQEISWQTTQTNAFATFNNLPMADYEVEVGAAGYLTTHQKLSVLNDGRKYEVEVTLKSDPKAAPVHAAEEERLPSAVRKNLARGVEDLKAGQWLRAQKSLEAAYTKAPSNPDTNFFLGYLHFKKNDFRTSESYLVQAANLDPQNFRSHMLLGRLYLQNQDYGRAEAAFSEAAKLDPENWTAHYFLGNVYLRRGEFEGARTEAEIALEKSRGSTHTPTLILAEALAQLGERQAAIQTLEGYLRSEKELDAAPDIHQSLAALRQPDGTNAALASSFSGVERVLASSAPPVSLETWHPIGVDDSTPAVAAGVTCPADEVIEGAGERVKELLDGLAKFDATENMLHEDLDEFGIPKNKVSLKFDYVAAISEKKPGVLLVDEYRTWRSQAEDFPDHIATRGLPALAFVFHPEIRENFEMKCEGLGSWNGTATWLVHFQQREDKPHHTQEYVVNGHVFPVSVKGRAWIAANTFQLVRLESDLVRPIPQIQLFSQHWTVDYGPVKFSRQNQELWLPKNAELYFDFLKHRYYRRHSFDHFMLFSVDTEEKRKEPTVPDSDQETQKKPRGLGTILLTEIP